jgi:hypothetical protein
LLVWDDEKHPPHIDVFFYTANTDIVEDDKFLGIAEFKSSRTGETKGLSWIYTYNFKDNTLMDNDSVIAFCN